VIGGIFRFTFFISTNVHDGNVTGSKEQASRSASNDGRR
jgi:hypothetical protein